MASSTILNVSGVNPGNDKFGFGVAMPRASGVN